MDATCHEAVSCVSGTSTACIFKNLSRIGVLVPPYPCNIVRGNHKIDDQKSMILNIISF